ncbi:DNA-binding transcriptional regulator, AcrR family [Brevibacterium sandarakinum]|uniref:DNA-binding transcriptional regulator, AcrR family n=1 Tax=Brevibacterium sandarakinum TaxID=629680 RepID=A0A1H1XF83_BRESA|nr:TetR family transcriptional regulator [Brevibacterium sandarakinum]SDT07927.1 DNA-binding transcriptional regulator, AcrR family [Brevibacterium sandarakinum]
MELRPPEGIGSRDRILWAAATMLGEEPGAVMSVRAVAARARVSTGSLQHHFPTKRALMDEVMTLVYDLVLPEDNIHDTSIPARERLVACLQRLLASVGADPREAWRQTFDRYIAAEPSAAAGAEYLAIERELRRRIEYCLNVLQDEGSLEPGDNARRAQMLFTIVNGLSIAQALPSDESRISTEIEVLYAAVDCTMVHRT